MRIISGKYKGKRLFEPKNSEIRPTSDKVKESVFDVIQFDVPDSDFLDLFAGSGAVGLEASSRGERAVFVDKSEQSIALVKKNCEILGEKAEIYRSDALSAVSRLAARGRKFDFIFLDPPYSDNVEKLFSAIASCGILKENGCIIYEHSAKNEAVFEGFSLKKAKQYGQIRVDFFEKSRKKCAVTGSFDPITSGHIDVIKRASADFDDVTVVMLKNEARNYLFGQEKREEFAKKALEAEGIGADFCSDDGMAADFCKSRGINVIVRGFRDAEDAAYEREMAAFNRERGVETLLLPATFPISATLVREKLAKGESLDGLVPDAIKEDIKSAYEGENGK